MILPPGKRIRSVEWEHTSVAFTGPAVARSVLEQKAQAAKVAPFAAGSEGTVRKRAEGHFF
jgi:hypothetical protein